VIRLCLSLEVTPLFDPPRETGFQPPLKISTVAGRPKFGSASIMSPWPLCNSNSLGTFQKPSENRPSVYRSHATGSIEQAPERRSFPSVWQLDLQAHPRGRIVYLRRTSEQDVVRLVTRFKSSAAIERVGQILAPSNRRRQVFAGHPTASENISTSSKTSCAAVEGEAAASNTDR
jgi:hypothetical protein